MTTWSATRPLIDRLLHDDKSYSITFARKLDMSPGPNIDMWTETTYIRHGIDAALGAMAQVLVTMSEESFGIIDVESAEEELLKVVEDQLKFPEELQQVQETISQITDSFMGVYDHSTPTAQDAIKQRETLRRLERDLIFKISTKNDMIAAARLDLEFAELVERIIAEMESGALDLEEEVDQDLLDLAGVPGRESRKTVGSFIYYYVKQLASVPMPSTPGSPLDMPKAYVLIESIA